MDLVEFWRDLYGDASGYLVVWTRVDKRSRWFNVQTQLDAAARYAAERGSHVYYSVCLQPTRPQNVCSRGSADTVCCVPGLWVDVDYQWDGHRKPNLPPTANDALGLIDITELPATYIIHSGHGFHAYWLFEQPFVIQVDSDRSRAAALCERLQRMIQQRAANHGWVVDSTYDLARVLRVPGSYNGEAQVEIVRHANSRYSIDRLEALLPEAPAAADTHTVTPAAAPPSALRIDPAASPPLDLWEALRVNDPDAARAYAHQRPDLVDQSLSGYDMSLACRAALAGWSDQQIVDLLISHRRSYGEGPKHHDYYTRTLDRARHAAAAAAVNHDTHTPLEERAYQHDHVDDSARAALLEHISSALRIRIDHIYRIQTRGEPTYRLVTERGEVTLPSVAGLIQQSRLRTHLAAIGHYVPTIKPAAWDRLAPRLLDACEDLDVGDESSLSGTLKIWLERYLDACPPETGDEWQAAALNGRPYRRDGTLFISTVDFRRYVTIVLCESISSRELIAELRAIGATGTIVPIRYHGRSTSRYMWQLPWL